MGQHVTEAQILNKLRDRPSKGPVKLSYAEADWLIHRIENPPTNALARRVLMDQAARKRLNRPGTVILGEDGRRSPKPAPPVIDVPITPPPRQEPPQSGWRGNSICDSNE